MTAKAVHRYIHALTVSIYVMILSNWQNRHDNHKIDKVTQGYSNGSDSPAIKMILSLL